jgi:26S proteasome regulatory subunit N2
MIFSQTTVSQEPKLNTFKETMDKVINDKDEHTLIRFGAIIGQGIMEIGGRNCTISLVSNSGNNRMGSIVGMALFSQYYYWFPMIHFLNLAVHPTILYGVDSNMKIDKNFKILSKAKPSVYGYPKEVKVQEKATAQKTQAAVLSTHSRVKAKTKRTQTFTSIQPAESVPNLEKLKEEEDKKDEEKEKEKVVEEAPEPEEEVLSNPCRIVPRQETVINHLENNDYVPLLGKRFNGFVMLKKINRNAKSDYFDGDNLPSQDKPTQVNQAKESTYQPVPTDDVEMPEDIEITSLNKK